MAGDGVSANERDQLVALLVELGKLLIGTAAVKAGFEMRNRALSAATTAGLLRND